MSLGALEHIDSSKRDIVEYVQSLGGANLIICTAPHSDSISAILPAIAQNGKVICLICVVVLTLILTLTSALGVITLVSAATDGHIQVPNLLLNINRATLRGFACGCAADAESCFRYSAISKVKAVVQEFSIEEFTGAYDSVMSGTASVRNVIVFP